MPNKSESTLLNNYEVNRIYNLKKSSLDRRNNISSGKIKEEIDPRFSRYMIASTKNASQIVFGSEDANNTRDIRSNRKSSMLPASPKGLSVDINALEGRRSS